VGGFKAHDCAGEPHADIIADIIAGIVTAVSTAASMTCHHEHISSAKGFVRAARSRIRLDDGGLRAFA